MPKRWHLKSIPPQEHILAIQQTAPEQKHPIMAALLAQRQPPTPSAQALQDFFSPSLENLHSPFDMEDMPKAAERLSQALGQKEKTLVYGDYDADGVTSVALMAHFLRMHDVPYGYYIPDRYLEGYGISLRSIDFAKQEGYTLIIALDCGSSDYKAAAHALQEGIDIIVCDHHLPQSEPPKVYALLNPQKPSCPYPFKGLSGCGVGFKLLQALCLLEKRDLSILDPVLEWVAISIAADKVPMVDENRILLHHGLRRLNTQPSLGIEALFTPGQPKPLSAMDLSFKLAPLLNAAGRMKDAKLAVQLLLATSSQEAHTHADALRRLNTERREKEKIMCEEAITAIEKGDPQHISTVLYNEDWHAGILGIVASRCLEQYPRPTILLTLVNGHMTGSGRSVEGFHLCDGLRACADLLERYGGHRAAAGLTLKQENFPIFKERFENIVHTQWDEEHRIASLDIDLDLPLQEVDMSLCEALALLAPYGTGYEEPVFVAREVYAEHVMVIGERHLRFYAKHQGMTRGIETIAFHWAAHHAALRSGFPFHMAYMLRMRNYQQKQSMQLVVKDLRFD